MRGVPATSLHVPRWLPHATGWIARFDLGVAPSYPVASSSWLTLALPAAIGSPRAWLHVCRMPCFDGRVRSTWVLPIVADELLLHKLRGRPLRSLPGPCKRIPPNKDIIQLFRVTAPRGDPMESTFPGLVPSKVFDSSDHVLGAARRDLCWHQDAIGKSLPFCKFVLRFVLCCADVFSATDSPFS